MTNTAHNHEDQEHEKRVAGAFRSSLFWNIANMGVTQIITTGVFIFLTHKLSAAVFGIFALGVVIIDYFNYQARSASVDAILQGRKFDKTSLNSAFWSALLVFGLVTILCMVSGGLLAASVDVPELKYVLPVLALSLLPIPFSLVPNALLMREHDFKGIALRGILAAVGGGIVAIAVVLSPFPEWALVAQRMVLNLASTLFVMIRARWVPTFNFEFGYAKSFLKDSTRIFGAQGIAASSMRILDVVVGMSFGAAAVGFMRIAARLIEALYGAFASPISTLWVVILSEGGETDQQRSTMFLRLTQMSALICLPVFGGVLLTSWDLVEFALNDEFQPVAPILAIFCAAGLLAPFFYFRNAALTAIRKLNLLLVFSIVDVAIVAIATILLSRFNLLAVMGSLIVVNTIRATQTIPILLKEMHTPLRSLIGAVAPAYFAILLMAGAILGIAPLIADMHVLARLAIKVALGAAIYLGYLLLVHRTWSETALSMIINRGKSTQSVAPA